MLKVGEWALDNNPLVNAPHTQADIMDSQWERPYDRQLGAFPTEAGRLQPNTGQPLIGWIMCLGIVSLFVLAPGIDEYRK